MVHNDSPQSYAIAFRVWVVQAHLKDTSNSDFPLFCKVEVLASKNSVKYRYKAITDDSQDNFWVKQPFEFPLDPMPKELRISCFRRISGKSSSLLGKIRLSNEQIQQFDCRNRICSAPLIAIQEESNKTASQRPIQNGTISYQVELIVDKVKHAFFLFSIFPEEILLQIFSFLDFETLQSVCLVSTKWNRLAEDDGLLHIMAKRAQRIEDFKSAHKLYLWAAKVGNDDSMDELGRMFQHGIGPEMDLNKAFMWYKRAAKQGNASGMNDLGWCYEKGLGCKQDDIKAAQWYLRSAESGNISGENNIGWCYQKGLGTPVDYKSAIKWYRRASEHGNSSGFNNLAWCYHQGLGVPQDYKLAMKTYKCAAELGNKFAQNTIGNMYYNGQGVSVNIEKAIKWFQKAAAQGHEAAKGRLALLTDKPAQNDRDS